MLFDRGEEGEEWCVDSAGVVSGCCCVYNEEFRVADYALSLFSGKVSAILSYFIQYSSKMFQAYIDSYR